MFADDLLFFGRPETDPILVCIARRHHTDGLDGRAIEHLTKMFDPSLTPPFESRYEVGTTVKKREKIRLSSLKKSI